MLDFFKKACQAPARRESLLGICDDEAGNPVYWELDLSKKENWGAVVENKDELDLSLTAVDKCVLKDEEYEGLARCDAMLRSSKHLFFVELKNQRKRWQKEAIEQLASTIELFLKYHDAAGFQHKKAYACNRKHPHFHVIDHEQKLRFKRQYDFRLDVQSSIIVV